jgi:transcriptional regulator GlxA family with amidase domain
VKKNVAILVFDDAEVLDFAGPFEVFSVASQINDNQLFNVFTVSKKRTPVKSVNGLSVNPDYSFRSSPEIDILIIAGGVGTRKLLQDRTYLNWVRKVYDRAEMILSICSGARLLGKLGLLDGIEYATHQEVYAHMADIAPLGIPVKEKRYTRGGKIYTSGGISAGIDLSFHVVETLHGNALAERTASYMEYHRNGYTMAL